MRRTRLIVRLLRLTRHGWLFAALTIFAAMLFGAFGFHFIEGLSWLDSFYMATETVTTVGYGDMPPRTGAGKIFGIIFMFVGGGTVLFALTILLQTMVQSEIIAAFDLRRRKQTMSKLEKHFIVCGAGRVGARIVQELRRQNCSFVVIERDERLVAPLIEAGEFVIVGDATLEDNLKKARVEQARGLAACLPDDADNVYVVLTARGLNKEMHIVARAVEEQAEPKLIRAGANRVVAPTIIGSLSMARALTKPAIADFMDSIAAENLELVFEEIAVEQSSPLVGKKLKNSNIRSELDVIIVAIKRKTGEMIFQPSGEAEINEGDLLIVIGRAEAMRKLIELAR
jgi:voltage-gated potassium channel